MVCKVDVSEKCEFVKIGEQNEDETEASVYEMSLRQFIILVCVETALKGTDYIFMKWLVPLLWHTFCTFYHIETDIL